MDFSYNDYIKWFENDGFLIPKLEVERPLYRYRGKIKNAVDEIRNDHIYLSPLDKLNDPFDSSCLLTFEEVCQRRKPLNFYYLGSYFLSQSAWYRDLGIYLEETIANQAEQQYVTLVDFANIVSKFAMNKGETIEPLNICKMYYEHCFGAPAQRKTLGRVASFSETWESIPMWAYYADSHKGVCMKYEFDRLDSSDISYQNVKNALHKVWYSEQRFNDPHCKFTPFVKSLQWAHEQEWRLFKEGEEEYLYIPCITEIYLGINFDDSKIDCIVDELKKKDRKIKIFQIYTKPNNYEFERVRINY